MSCQKTKKMKSNRTRPSLQKKQGAKPLQTVRRSYGEILAGYDLKMKDILSRMERRLGESS